MCLNAQDADRQDRCHEMKRVIEMLGMWVHVPSTVDIDMQAVKEQQAAESDSATTDGER
jgi:hypothetical protein